MLTLYNIGKKKKSRKRVGRGNASGHGSFSTRGIKGQRARSGGKKGMKLKGFKRTLLNLPKFKGMVSHRQKAQVVHLSILEKKFADNDKITPGALFQNKIIDNMNQPVKILKDKNEIQKKFEIFDCQLSAASRAVIEKAGGKIIDIEKEINPKSQIPNPK